MAPKNLTKMRDYTSNNYCDFLWINELLELKKNSKHGFTFEIWKNGKATPITVSNVIIFGTIVEVKQVGYKGFLYHVDDGTGVIACKHSEQQFEEVIFMIESEQCDLLKHTMQSGDSGIYISADSTADDSIFNDKSIQIDEVNVNEKNRLMGLQSIWEDIYQSFHSLIEQYNIGDSVVIQGKLYSYFNKNQIYVNSIRKMDLAEEISKVAVKLEQKFDKIRKHSSSESSNRLSGLLTFDNIQELNPKFSNPRNIIEPETKDVKEEHQGNALKHPVASKERHRVFGTRQASCQYSLTPARTSSRFPATIGRGVCYQRHCPTSSPKETEPGIKNPYGFIRGGHLDHSSLKFKRLKLEMPFSVSGEEWLFPKSPLAITRVTSRRPPSTDEEAWFCHSSRIFNCAN